MYHPAIPMCRNILGMHQTDVCHKYCRLHFCGIPSNPTWTLQETSAVQPCHGLMIRDCISYFWVGNRHFFFFKLWIVQSEEKLFLALEHTVHMIVEYWPVWKSAAISPTTMDLITSGWRFIFNSIFEFHRIAPIFWTIFSFYQDVFFFF